MTTNRYSVPAREWANTPIRRAVNPLTGLIEGDDSGYRKMRTLPGNPAKLVVPAIEIRAVYDGVNEFGKRDKKFKLPGGLPNGQLVVRETFARDLEDADQFLLKEFGGAYKLGALDGFRSCQRQAAGFTGLLNVHMDRLGLSRAEVENDDRVLDFITAGNAADGTFSWVNPDVNSGAYKAVVADLQRNDKLVRQLEERAATLGSGNVTTESVAAAVYEYIVISANSGIGRAANRNIPLVFECNAHAGGGACDIFLLDKKGKPVNHVPFDWAGPEAGMDYLENDDNFPLFLAKVRTEPALRAYLANLGITPDSFSMNHWTAFRSGIRILYHLTRAKRWTYYSSDHGGENWHIEGGNTGYDIVTGNAYITEPLTGGQYMDSGNPGHVLQMRGRDGVAVWGGKSGHERAKELGLVM